MKPTPSNLEDHLGYWLRKLSNQVSATFADRLAKRDVSVPQWVVLRVLFDHDSLSLKDIVSRVEVDQGSLSRMIDRLIARGLVSRRENPLSRREVAISLTKEGRQLVPHLACEADENDRAFFATLTAPQRRRLLATIHHLLELNQITPKSPIT